MKVLMLGWELPPHNSGGLGVACYQLCKSLADNGSDIDFILPYNEDYSEIDFMEITPAHHQSSTELLVSGNAYSSYAFNELGKHDEVDDLGGLMQQVAMYERNVAGIIENKTFDVIHAHDWLTFRAALRAKMQTGKPLIVHVHATEFDRSAGGHGNPLVREIESTTMHLADEVIAVSQITKDVIVEQYKIPEEKIKVVHNSIEISEGSLEIKEENEYAYLTQMKKRGFKVVSYIGRITVQKNLVNLLYSAKKVIKNNPKTLFLIVGSGEQENELIALSAELGISKNVIFTGFLRGKKWRDSFLASDLFVMPSVSEPFGLTPLEAIGFGVPALISNQSGVSEVLNNVLKVDFWDVDEMANQIVGILKSESLSKELLENAQKELSRLSWAKSAQLLDGIYQKQVTGVSRVSGANR